jgi:molybdate transport system substrate-binding protein
MATLEFPLPRRAGAALRVAALALGLVAAAAAIASPALAANAPLRIAAAANLAFAMDALDAAFAKSDPGVTVTVSTGASGDLVAQIEHGAPFDVFLSADVHFAQVLASAGAADPKSLNTFAYGRLVLWTTRPGLDVTDVASAVRNPAVRHLAIANMSTAPYGRAARQALGKLGAWAEAEPKLVVGESISQTTQFVDTGNADAGFVALSVVLSPKLKGKGTWSEVPAALYEPLGQAAVITGHGAGNPDAVRYLAFLQGPEARAVLEGLGYRTPVR